MKSYEITLITKKQTNNVWSIINVYLPLIVAQSYLLFTVLLFFFGPWPWPIVNVEKVLLFLLCCQSMFAFGYYIAIRTKKVKKLKETLNVKKIIKICLQISILTLIPLFYIRTGIILLDINTVLMEIYNGIINPGEQYIKKILSYQKESSNVVLIVITLISAPFTWMILPLSLYYWNSLSLSYKIAIFFVISVNTLSWIAIGTNKGLFDLIIVYLSILLIQHVYSVNKKRKTMFKYIFLLTVLIIVISYFTIAIESRMGGINKSIDNPEISVDEERILYRVTPEVFKGSLISLGSYLTQGYYGLSLSLEEPYTPTLGLGNSIFISSFLEEKLKIDYFIKNSYPSKIEKHGWDRLVNWHTFYVWFASDITFFGLPLLMFILGYFLSVIWKDILINENPYAISIFSLLLMLIFYIPANNQVFSFPHSFFTFYSMTFLWLFNNKFKIK